MRVVVAPDKFKGSLSAPEVAAHLALGLTRAAPGTEVVQVPVADGGDGTLDAAVSAGYRRVDRVLAGAGRGRGDVGRGGAALAAVASLDLSGLHPALRETDVVVASDVDNPLLGPRGAAAVYGPQKGASPEDVAELDAALACWARAVHAATGVDAADRPGAGAAGGVGFAALAVLGATLQPGIDLVLDLVGFRAALPGASLVITGEGSLDEQTLHGKAPAGVAAAAAKAGIPVVTVSGRLALDGAQLQTAGIS